jgi:hypothetical protein
LLFLWTLLLAVPALAQDADGLEVPPAPQNLILDEARLFSRQPERLQAIATALAALEEKHGYRLYFAVYDTLIGHSLEEQATTLREKWLGDQPGAVLVLEADSFLYLLGQAPPLEQEIEPGKKVQRDRPTDLSPIDQGNIKLNLEPVLVPVGRDRQAFAETLGTGFAREIGTLLDQRAAIPAGAGRSRMVLLAIGLLAVVGLVALLVVAALKRVEARSKERYVFPKVGVGLRLGAPYGGGKVSTREFGRKDK